MAKIRIIKNKRNEVTAKKKSESTKVDKYHNPPIGFSVLLDTFEDSSNISGIITKIASKTAMKFAPTPSIELDRVLAGLDIEAIALDMLVFGSCFFERLKNLKWEWTLQFERLLTPNMRIAVKNNENIFAYYTENATTDVSFLSSEILFFKRSSLSDSHYGDSLFSKSVNEIVLLTFITKYFKKFFKNGNISPIVLYAESGQLTEEQMDKLESMINDSLSGLENADTTAIVGTKLGKIDLATIFDPEKFISLKRELKEDIAIALNIPFDLISSQDSNRSTSDVAMRMLYSDIILPLQAKILKQIKSQFLSWFDAEKLAECWKGITREDIEGISFEAINLNDPEAQMKTLVGYKKEGILNANEVRKMAGLGDDIEGGEEYIISGNSVKSDEEAIVKIRKNIEKLYTEKS